MVQDIVRFLERDKLRCLASREIYHLENAKVLAFTGDALLMALPGGLYAVSADTGDAALKACSGLTDCRLMCCDCMEAAPKLRERFGLGGILAFYNVIYPHTTPVPVPEGVTLAPIEENQADRVCADYTILPPEEVKRHIADQTLLGGYRDGRWVGFIGVHDEGSMGMLHIFPEYRQQGIGYALEGMLINRLLKEGRLPWAQVLVTNHASLALQEKLTMERSTETVCWVR